MTTMADSPTEFSPEGTLQISEEAFRRISKLVYERFGINLTDKKKALVRGRLHSLVRASGKNSFEEYFETVIEDESGKRLLQLIDKISTNHSYFFREADHLDFLSSSVLPELLPTMAAEGTKDIRIWSAGCAAGEEAYSIAMVLSEYFGHELHKFDIGILATDISLTALEQGVEARYAEQKIDAVPERYRRYFTKEADGRYRVNEKIRNMVVFKRLNLMRPDYPFRGRFHVIFCRNVMIYFDQDTRKALLSRFHRYLNQGSYLFIGHSETLGRDTGLYRYVKPTIYKSVGG